MGQSTSRLDSRSQENCASFEALTAPPSHTDNDLDIANDSLRGADGPCEDESLMDENTPTDLVKSDNQLPLSTALSNIATDVEDVASIGVDNELWVRFMQMTGEIFLCWDPRSTNMGHDPFAVNLPIMATNSRTLRYAALALSAQDFSQRRRGRDERRLGDTASALGMAASRALVPAITPASYRPQHFLDTVSTVSLLVLADPTTYVGLLPLARSAAACLIKHNNRAAVNQDHLSMALFQLLYIDICAQSSIRHRVQLSSDEIHSVLEQYADTNDTYTADLFSGWTVHPFYGFSRRLIRPLLRLARAMRSRQSDTDISLTESPSQADVDSLEMLLLQARQADLTSQKSAFPEEAELLHINDAWHEAAQIIFYTRLKDMPWTSLFVRKLVKSISDRVQAIDPHSRSLVAAPFPLYIAGCEAADLVVREDIKRLLGCLPGYWRSRQETLIESLRQVWAARDNDPGAVWTTWIQKVSTTFKETVLPV